MSRARQRIGLVLLAAGGSFLLGPPKQLRVFQGRTRLRHAGEEAAASEVTSEEHHRNSRGPDERRCSDDKSSRWNCGHYTG